MRYTKYSFRDLEAQDAYMWDGAEFDLLLNEIIPNRSITPYSLNTSIQLKILKAAVKWVQY